jgi:hypothetical protein
MSSSDLARLTRWLFGSFGSDSLARLALWLSGRARLALWLSGSFGSGSLVRLALWLSGWARLVLWLVGSFGSLAHLALALWLIWLSGSVSSSPVPDVIRVLSPSPLRVQRQGRWCWPRAGVIGQMWFALD